MNVKGKDKWVEARWEALDHNKWMLIQELGDNYYRQYENNDTEEEDEEEAMIRLEWKELEEKAKEKYSRVIAGEEKRGNKIQTVAELINFFSFFFLTKRKRKAK